MKSFCLLLGSLLLLNLSCKKEEKLPKPTEKGANTFGCKIEGRLFLPQRSTNFGSMPPLLTYYNDSSRHFELSVKENPDISNNRLQRYFHLEVQNLSIGTNSLDDISTGEVSISELDQAGQAFTTTQTIGGTLNIKRLDTVAHIISGTFSFKAAMRPTNTPGKIISVTEGRFDITYE
jgi:hypothetical protein